MGVTSRVTRYSAEGRLPTAPCLLTGFIVLLLALTACGSDGGGSGTPELPPYVVAVWEDASEFQQEILADGTVTPEEYERAVFAALQCLDDAGILHSQPVLDASGVRAPKWRFTIGPYPPGAQGIADECQSYYLTAITGVWSAQEAPTEAELQGRPRVRAPMREGAGSRRSRL